MTKILIADDEKLIRAGIKKILEGSLGSSIEVLEAKNGRDAFELCTTSLPDILITDIRMPGMDGTELMEHLAVLPQKPAIIVLSGFDDFSYAQSAISSGALAYLLKPVDEKELLSAVEKALSGVRREQQQKNEEKLRSLISDGIMEAGSSFDVNEFSKTGVCCVSFASCLCNKNSVPVFENLRHYILDRKRNFMTVLFSEEDISRLEENLLALDEDTCYVAGISRPSSQITELRRLRHESFTAFLASFFAEKKRGVFKYTEELSVSDFTEADTAFNKVLASLDLLNDEEVRKNLKNMFNFDGIESEKRAETLHYIRNKIVNNLFNRYPRFNETDTYLYLKSLMIENIFQAESLAEWETYVLDYILYLMELLKNSQGKYASITKAVAFISKHYKEDITMATVANHVSMNYTWFSEKFKEQMGLNFNDYLKRFRMEQAKRLLEMGTYKVYEVSAKCGFKDVKHFMKVFREMNGMSAGEWARVHTVTSI